LQLHINATNVKIVVFIELNDKDAYCAHENARNARNVENIDAFMNMSQLKVTQIWDIRLNEYSRYWLLKALKSVTVTLYKLQMFDALFAFTLLIVYLTSSSEMCKSNNIVKSINKFAILLMFIWKNERMNFSRNISIFFLNVVVI